MLKLKHVNFLIYKYMLNIEVKILSKNELEDFRAIRLSALEKAPEMFGSTYLAEVDKPLIFLKLV